MYDGITGRSPIATDDLGYIGTGQKASQIMANGTTDYNDLSNKPTINDVELSGNKTSSDLGLQSALTTEQLSAVNSGVTAETVAQVGTNTINISSLQTTVTSLQNLIATFHPVTITTQPTDVSAADGETAYFTVTAIGVGLTYQWQYHQPNWTSDDYPPTSLPGSNTATLQVPAAVSRNGNKYRCVITDILNQTATSNAATLTVT